MSPPQPDLLVSVLKAAHTPRLQRLGDLFHVVPLRTGERQRHIPPPPVSRARAAVRSRHDYRVSHGSPQIDSALGTQRDYP